MSSTSALTHVAFSSISVELQFILENHHNPQCRACYCIKERS